MSVLSRSELDYLLSERRIGRLATADGRGQPQVTPVGMWSYNSATDTIDIGGHDLAATKKYRNIDENPRAALLVDDIASVDPWRPRAVMIQGSARAVPDGGDHGDPVIRITPENVASWGLD